MNFMFDVERLTAGAKEVSEVYELADILGVNVIKITGKDFGSSQFGVSGFEIPKFGLDPRGNVSGATTDFGYIYLYPDKRNTMWGFVIDTEHNRKVLASHIAAPVLDIADKKVKEEIIEYCNLNGINTVPESGANPYIKKSTNEIKLETKASQLDLELRKAQAELKKLQEEKDEVERSQLIKAQYREGKEDHTVTEVQFNPETGEGEEVEVEATTQALNQESAKKTKTSKASKPLAGKKLTKK